MKKIVIALTLVAAVIPSAMAQKQLPEPDKSLNVRLMDALQMRRSTRSFDALRDVTDQQLSQILWAACGINNAEKKLLTTPTAMNSQDISVYVCTKNGVSLYEPLTNTLKEVTKTDIRALLAGRQESVKSAPVFLLLASDTAKFPRHGEHWGAVDAGYVSQDIYLMCAALGLKTVARGIMEQTDVAKILGLPESVILELNHPIGY